MPVSSIETMEGTGRTELRGMPSCLTGLVVHAYRNVSFQPECISNARIIVYSPSLSECICVTILMFLVNYCDRRVNDDGK